MDAQSEKKVVRKNSKSTVTKKTLVNLISQEKEINPRDVQHVIQAFLDKMTDYLAQGHRLEFRDFGVFEIVERKQKVGRNPKRADEPIIIPPRKVVKYTPGKKMRHLTSTAEKLI
jgi:integration host factor subunit beta